MRKIAWFILLMILITGSACDNSKHEQLKGIQSQIHRFSAESPGESINPDSLPAPYDYLLTQPLMTLGIEHYYQRTPIIQTIYAQKDEHNHTYYRAILMWVDKNKTRNNAELARQKNEAMVVELAFITINFNELPEEVKKGVLESNIPFGKLLAIHHVAADSKNRTYFSVTCDKQIAMLTGCQISSKLYARTNTLVRRDNQAWLAHVVEIMSVPKGTSS